MRETTWLDNFPHDVQVYILKRLPLKTLLRLMCTSKSIYGRITSPTLMIAASVRDTGYHIYSYCASDGHQRFLSCLDTKIDFKIRGNITSIDIDVNYFLLGSIYGLVCFAKTFHPKDSDIILWNPFLGKSLTLPIPVAASDKSCAIGFGFDHHCIDYKIVRIGIIPGCNSNPCIWADVYVLRAGCWKSIVGSLSRPASSIMGDGVFMNNTLHWIIKFPKSNNGHVYEEYSILTYNLSKEVFREIEIDEIMTSKFMVLATLTIDGQEKLVLYRDDQHRDFYIWVMEEYGVSNSWRRICVMESKDHDGGEYMKVLHARKNGEIVLSTTKGRLILCKIKDNEKSIKVIQDYKGSHQLDYVGPFMGSLVFVDEQHCGGPLSGKRMRMEEDEPGKADAKTRKRLTTTTKSHRPAKKIKLVEEEGIRQNLNDLHENKFIRSVVNIVFSLKSSQFDT